MVTRGGVGSESVGNLLKRSHKLRFWGEEDLIRPSPAAPLSFPPQHTPPPQLLDYSVTLSLAGVLPVRLLSSPYVICWQSTSGKISFFPKSVPVLQEVHEDCPDLICLRSNFIIRC